MNATSRARPPSLSRRRASTSSPGARRTSAGVMPHTTPNSMMCLCPACHLRPIIFPRRQDGRIILPDPVLSQSRLSHGRAPYSSTMRELGARIFAIRDITILCAHGGTMSLDIEHEEPMESTRREYQDHVEDGTPGNIHHLSGPGIPERVTESSMPPQYVGAYNNDATSRTTSAEYADHATRRRQRRKGRASQPERSSASASSKIHDENSSMNIDIDKDPDRPGTWPPIQVHGVPAQYETNRSGQNLPLAYGHVTSQASHRSGTSTGDQRGALGSYSYDDLGPQPLSQFATPLPQFGDRDANLSNNTAMFPPGASLRSSSDVRRNPTATASRQSSVSRSSSHSKKSRPISPNQSSETSHHGDVHAVEEPPRVIRFNSRPRNPQPQMWTTNNQTVPENYSEESPQAGPSEPLQTLAGPLRFQDPVTPQIHLANAARTRPRENLVVQVKWDSERKRRQGYFAQEDGAEKSPFRHYNKTGCDFDS